MLKGRSKRKHLQFNRWGAAGIVLLSLVAPGLIAAASGSEAQRRTQTRRTSRRPAPPRTNYSEFSHATHVTNQKLACASCHTFPTKNWKDARKGEAAFPDVAEFPDHSACIGCHRAQFFARERPAPAICSNCHVNVTPRNTSRFLFPSLGDVTDSKLTMPNSASEFAVGFPHDKHIDVVGIQRRDVGEFRFLNAEWIVPQDANQSKSCVICHQLYQPQGKLSEEYVTKPPKDLGDNFWLKKGTFQTVPNSHAACFTCHTADGIPPEPKDCQVCHSLAGSGQLKVDYDPKRALEMGIADRTTLKLWATRMSSGTFRHEGGMHPDVSCTSCHNIPTMNTAEPKTLKVAVGSCGGAEGCHITPRTDDGGALNFEVDQKKTNSTYVCSKCHITFGRESVPASHGQAIAGLKP